MDSISCWNRGRGILALTNKIMFDGGVWKFWTADSTSIYEWSVGLSWNTWGGQQNKWNLKAYSKKNLSTLANEYKRLHVVRSNVKVGVGIDSRMIQIKSQNQVFARKMLFRFLHNRLKRFLMACHINGFKMGDRALTLPPSWRRINPNSSGEITIFHISSVQCRRYSTYKTSFIGHKLL